MKVDLFELAGGLALFLFAMTLLEESLKALGGRSFMNLLRRGSRRPLRSVIGGTVATAMMQSSSVVGLMVLAFVGAGIMPLKNALGVIIGSNLGTTFTGWVVAALGFRLNIEDLALPLVAGGTLILISTAKKTSQWGRLLVGLGLLLLGLSFMKESVAELKATVDVTRLAGYSPWQFMLFGTLFAAVIQSSSATMMINLTALNAGIISLPSAAAIAIGADLGTTTTVLLGAIKGVGSKKRVAMAHFLFNLVTDVIAFVFRNPLLSAVALIGFEDPLLSLVAFHSLFNLLGIAIFYPLLQPFAIFLERFFHREEPPASRYIAEVNPVVGDAAVLATAQETAHLIGRVLKQNARVFEPPLELPPGRMPVPVEHPLESEDFGEIYERTKALEGEILSFASRVTAQPLESEASVRLNQLLSSTRSAVLSAKTLKDVRHNLAELHDSTDEHLHRYSGFFRGLASLFYRDVYRLWPKQGAVVSFESLVEVLQNVHREHDQIHAEIYDDIGEGDISAGEISSLLNVNREIRNSNVAMIMALKDYHLDAGKAEAMEQLPHMT